MKHSAMNPHDQVPPIKNGQVPPEGRRGNAENLHESTHLQAAVLLEEGKNPFLALMSEHERIKIQQSHLINGFSKRSAAQVLEEADIPF